MKLFYELAEAFFIAAELLEIPITWGGAWTEKHEEYQHNLNVKFYPSAEFMQEKYKRNRNRDGSDEIRFSSSSNSVEA